MRIITAANSRVSYSGPRRSRNQMQRDAAREAAMDRELARYIHLSCGHLSTQEVHILYANWRPRRNQSWCENCNDWVDIAKPPAPQEYPQEPLF